MEKIRIAVIGAGAVTSTVHLPIVTRRTDLFHISALFDAAAKARYMYRFTIHSFRDRFGTTAADEWGYSERQLLEQGSWADAETVRKFYLGTTDATYQSVRDLHNKVSRAANRRKAS